MVVPGAVALADEVDGCRQAVCDFPQRICFIGEWAVKAAHLFDLLVYKGRVYSDIAEPALFVAGYGPSGPDARGIFANYADHLFHIAFLGTRQKQSEPVPVRLGRGVIHGLLLSVVSTHVKRFCPATSSS